MKRAALLSLGALALALALAAAWGALYVGLPMGVLKARAEVVL